MNLSEWIGTAGVTLLLFAYVGNLVKRLPADGVVYTLLNLVGAALTCLSSVLILFYPFIILEGAWTLISLYGFIKSIRKKI